MSSENIMRLWNDCVTGGKIRPKFKVVVKTSSYTVTSDDFGTVFTTRGGTGAVVFTLPAASAVNKHNWAMFLNVADQDMTVAGAEAGLVVFNNLTANSIGFATGGEKIGGGLLAMSDGTSWVVLPLGTETQTVTVGTAGSSSPSASVSNTPSASVSASPSTSPSASVSASPSTSPSASVSNTPSSSPSPSASVSASPSTSPSASVSASPSTSPSASVSNTPSSSPSGT